MEMETNEDFLIPYFRSKGFSAQKGVGRRREVLDPVLEVPLFRAPLLNDSRDLPEERKSKVRKLILLSQLKIIDLFIHSFFATRSLRVRADLISHSARLVDNS